MIKLGDFLKNKLAVFVKRMGEGVRLVPVLVKKPAVALHWLATARIAQVAIVVLALTVPTVIAGAIDSLLEKQYPPRVHEELFGLMKKTYTNPRLSDKKEQARSVLWVSSGGLVFLLLFLHIPEAVKSAEKKSRKIEAQADAHLQGEPSKSVLLYRSALKLATCNDQIASLKNKTGAIDKKVLGKEPDPESTLLVSPPVKQSGQSEAGRSGGLLQSGGNSRYRVKGTLGKGTTGITYRAFDPVLERDVAIKELHRDLAGNPELTSRFRREAKVLAQLTHPGIVQVYDFVEEGGRILIVMELVRGGELTDLLRERGHITVPEAARLGVSMTEAMGYAHARGIVHRDFKPSNVMLTVGGSPKIADFGLATFAREAREGEVAGSPYYMSPEQAEGKSADARSDVYAMGAVLYQMLTGSVPFDGDDVVSVLNQHRSRDPVPPRRILREIPEELDSLILTMLAKDPEERMRDMTGIARVLKKYVVIPVPQETSASPG